MVEIIERSEEKEYGMSHKKNEPIYLFYRLSSTTTSLTIPSFGVGSMFSLKRMSEPEESNLDFSGTTGLSVPDPNFIGYLRPYTNLVEPSSLFIPGLRHIYATVGDGSCDIGKGWLTAALAANMEDPLIFKIDPMLNKEFPTNVGIEFQDKIVSDDFRTYMNAGLPVSYEQNILLGEVLSSYYQKYQPAAIGPNEVKKQTYADLEQYFAERIITIAQQTNPRNIIIEIGGIVVDNEQEIISKALRLLGCYTGISPELFVLTSLTHIPNTGRVVEGIGKLGLKTQAIRMAIRNAGKSYTGININSVFARRGLVPHNIPTSYIEDELQRVAYETQYDPRKIIFEDDVSEHHQLVNFIKSLGLFYEGPEKALYVASPTSSLHDLSLLRNKNINFLFLDQTDRKKSLPHIIARIVRACRENKIYTVVFPTQEKQILLPLYQENLNRWGITVEIV
jgi:hypothetical protein